MVLVLESTWGFGFYRFVFVLPEEDLLNYNNTYYYYCPELRNRANFIDGAQYRVITLHSVQSINNEAVISPFFNI
jgi:hypothetical protein